MWFDIEVPLPMRLLERIIDFNQLSQNTLVLIEHLYPENVVLHSKLRNTKKYECFYCNETIKKCVCGDDNFRECWSDYY
jgi:hypothetical protein